MEKQTGFRKALGYSFPEEDKILIRKDLPKDLEKEVKQHEEEHILKGEEGPGLFSFIGDLFGSSKQAKSADRATAAQERAAEEQIAFARESRDLARGDVEPYRQAGYTALDALMSMTGLGGGGGAQGPSVGVAPPKRGINAYDYLGGLNRGGGGGGRSAGTNRVLPRNEGGPIYGRAYGGYIRDNRQVPPTGWGGPQPIHYNVNETGPENVFQGGAVTRNSNPRTVAPSGDGYVAPRENPGGVEGGYNFMTDPGYGFRIGEGQRAIERGAAARGGLLSGGLGRRLTRYAQDYASNEYTNVYNRISNIAGLGQVAGAQSGNAALMTGQQRGGAASDRGFARASGYSAQGNIWGDALRSGGQFLDDAFRNRRIDKELNPVFSDPDLF
jgi:hypothetical protein